MAITLYTLPACPHSEAMRKSLQQRGSTYTEINLALRPECVPELVKLTGKRRIVPVLVDGVRVHVAPNGGTEF